MRKALVLFGLLFIMGAVLPGQTPEKEDGKQQEQAEATAHMGTQLCSSCHLDIYETFQKSAHGVKRDERTPEGKEGCENCHGNGVEHATSAGGKGIGGLKTFKADIPAEERNAACLSCHNQGRVALWHAGIHETKGLACNDC